MPLEHDSQSLHRQQGLVESHFPLPQGATGIFPLSAQITISTSTLAWDGRQADRGLFDEAMDLGIERTGDPRCPS
jgi:hypothetical protein